MKPSLFLSLAALPLLFACADGGQRPLAGRAGSPTQSGPEAEWVHDVLSAKVAGSLYRAGGFFPNAPTAADTAAGWP